ncbi:hypothetical protein [Halomonas sp.]|uniref:hypothetical protein n=1 Tax=Halomonas sp. TaxID=1486246 RepID=UPI003F8EB36B
MKETVEKEWKATEILQKRVLKPGLPSITVNERAAATYVQRSQALVLDAEN